MYFIKYNIIKTKYYSEFVLLILLKIFKAGKGIHKKIITVPEFE